MTLNRLKELSAAGYTVALAPEQMMELLNELEALRGQVKALKDYAIKLCIYKSQVKRYQRIVRDYKHGKITQDELSGILVNI